MSKPHLASVVEDRWNRALGGLLTRAGWQPRIVGYAGYGGADFVRVLARVVLDRPPGAGPAAATSCGAGGATSSPPRSAGSTSRSPWPGESFVVTTDRSGIVDARLPRAGLAPGWHQVDLAVDGAQPGTADVVVVADDVDFGIVSDIDDTVITTWLPRLLLATYNTFVLAEEARKPVDGMAELYAALLAGPPGRAHGLRLHRSVERRARADAVPGPPRLPARSAAAHRLGAHQHRVVPQRPRAQAGLPARAWPRTSRRSAGCWSATTASATR